MARTFKEFLQQEILQKGEHQKQLFANQAVDRRRVIEKADKDLVASELPAIRKLNALIDADLDASAESFYFKRRNRRKRRINNKNEFRHNWYVDIDEVYRKSLETENKRHFWRGLPGDTPKSARRMIKALVEEMGFSSKENMAEVIKTLIVFPKIADLAQR
jgi:hypothetical protein